MSTAWYSFCAATTTAVGWRCTISFANDGPLRNASGVRASRTSSPSASRIASESSWFFLRYRPFEVLHSTTPGAISARFARKKSGVVCAGSAWMTSCAPASASATSSVARRHVGSAVSVKYLGLAWCALMCATCAGSRAYTVTAWPLVAATYAIAVPNSPAPSTAMRIGAGL